jgi:transcriptional regulator
VAKREPDGLDKVDVPQGTLELMILTILAREPLHGYGISQRLTALSHDHFRVNPGSLFPSLYRLEQDGKLKAEWRASENNRNAKYYRLTASGRRQLEEHRTRWERISFAISSVLEGA